MRKKELIAALEKIPGNPLVALLDIPFNNRGDNGEGSSQGIYVDLTVEYMCKPDLAKGQSPWIAIGYDADDRPISDDQLMITAADFEGENVKLTVIQTPELLKALRTLFTIEEAGFYYHTGMMGDKPQVSTTLNEAMKELRKAVNV